MNKTTKRKNSDLSHIEDSLKPFAVPIDSVDIDPANARRHPETNMDALVASMKRFGQQQPILVDQKGVCVAGSGRLNAARQLGWNHIAVIQTKLVGSDRASYAIADNRIAELADWDNDALAQLLAVLQRGRFG